MTAAWRLTLSTPWPVSYTHLSKTLDGVKVLGNGELTKALNVKVAAYTASAKEKIEKAGGKAEVM